MIITLLTTVSCTLDHISLIHCSTRHPRTNIILAIWPLVVFTAAFAVISTLYLKMVRDSRLFEVNPLVVLILMFS